MAGHRQETRLKRKATLLSEDAAGHAWASDIALRKMRNHWLKKKIFLHPEMSSDSCWFLEIPGHFGYREAVFAEWPPL